MQEEEGNFIGNEGTEMSLLDLAQPCPNFLRFNDVLLVYERIGPKSIEAKCHSIGEYLQLLALEDSNSFMFGGRIKQYEPSCFSDHSVLVAYLSDRLLPLCNSFRRYEFDIWFQSDRESATNVISSILQLTQNMRCSNLNISLYCLEMPTLLPVEAISNWLNRKMEDALGNVSRTPKETLLKICLGGIQNMEEMCDHLATVLFLFVFISRFKIF